MPSSSAPPVTTAPPGASAREVEAGRLEVEAIEQRQQPSRAKYAEGGSLAQDLREKEGKKKAGEPSSG